MVTVPRGAAVTHLERDWVGDALGAQGERTAQSPPAGLPTLHFFRLVLRRGVWQWCLIAAAGLLIGLSLSLVLPPADQAATTVLLSHNPSEQPGDAILTDAALVRSRPVALRAMHELGVRQSVNSFLAAYSVTPVTDRVLLITMGAPSMSGAVARANAVATAFLQVRAQSLRDQLPGVLASLNQQISVAWRKADGLAVQIAAMSGHARTRAQKASFKRLKSEGRRAANQLNGLQLAASSYQVATVTEIADSQVLDPAAAITHTRGSVSSSLRAAALYAVTGLIPGLALGMGFVIVRALLSRRLRRRDDITYALGAPIGLSVGAIHRRGLLRRRPGLAAATGPDSQRIVAHLRRSVRPSSGETAALAVVVVGDTAVPALSLASLAISCAEQGRQVVLADLCRGAPAARLLGTRDPGVHRVNKAGAQVIVSVPDPGAVAPSGPLRHGSGPTGEGPSPALAAACDSAELLLTLTQLDPSLGAEHLATWTADAVVMITAGQSTWTKIHAVREMLWLAGLRLAPAVLIAADKSDESLGVVHAPGLMAPAAYSLPGP